LQVTHTRSTLKNEKKVELAFVNPALQTAQRKEKRVAAVEAATAHIAATTLVMLFTCFVYFFENVLGH